ncbi:hypothetical protein A3850_007570 [Lewinella sp. 4G2]|nr:hypothetical protein A3850_007570 [Lewinella sp. 4G2]
MPTGGDAHGEFRDRGSKFVARLAHVRDEAAALAIVEEEAALHHKCNHHCYAYRIGEGTDRWRANDDGEPSGTAGKPILGQIDKAGLSDVVIVVSRYWGGTKLGASGLINAYREAAALAVESVEKGWQPLVGRVEIKFGYELMTPVMSALSQLDLEMASQDFGDSATVQLEIPRSQVADKVKALKAAIGGVYLEEVDKEYTVAGLDITVH